MDDKDNIHDEDHLDELAPGLSQLRKGEGFDVPADYFDDLASRIQQRIAEDDELRELAPVLSGIPKYNPFTVPAGYFDELPSKVQERILASKKASWTERFAWLFRPQFAIAAVVITLLTVAIILMNNNKGQEEPVENAVAANTAITSDTAASDSLSITEEAALYSMDESAIAELQSEQLQATEETSTTEDNSEEIVTYLVDNNIDVASIVNEL